MDLVEEEEAVAMVVAMAVVIMAAMAVVIMAATDQVILNLILIATNPLEQKDGKIEAKEILLKTLNLKVEEVGEKEAFLVRVIPQIIQISIQFLVANKSIQEDILCLILFL